MKPNLPKDTPDLPKVQMITLASGIVPDFAEALKVPADYALTYDLLGWSLRHVDSDFSVLVNEHQAYLFVLAMNKVRKEFKAG